MDSSAKLQPRQQERTYLDATLAHLKGRALAGNPVHAPPSTREMISKIYHVHRELLSPLKAHFASSLGFADLDALLLHTRDRFLQRHLAGPRRSHHSSRCPYTTCTVQKKNSHFEDSRRYLNGKNNSEEVLALVHHLGELLAESERDILHICHSQGAALTKLAAGHLQ